MGKSQKVGGAVVRLVGGPWDGQYETGPVPVDVPGLTAEERRAQNARKLELLVTGTEEDDGA